MTICSATNPYGMIWDADAIVFGQGRGGIMRVAPRRQTGTVRRREGRRACPWPADSSRRSSTFCSHSRAVRRHQARSMGESQIVVQTLATSEQKTVSKAERMRAIFPQDILSTQCQRIGLRGRIRREPSGDHRWRRADRRRRPARAGRGTQARRSLPHPARARWSIFLARRWRPRPNSRWSWRIGRDTVEKLKLPPGRLLDPARVTQRPAGGSRHERW